MFVISMNLMWINIPQYALTYGENPNSICLSIQKLFKKQWRTFLKRLDISCDCCQSCFVVNISKVGNVFSHSLDMSNERCKLICEQKPLGLSVDQLCHMHIYYAQPKSMVDKKRIDTYKSVDIGCAN